MFPTAVWAMLVMFIAWKGGLNQGKLPAPYHMWGATGAMAIAGLVGMLNKPTGNVLAVGLAVGAVMYYQTNTGAVNTTDAISLTTPGSSGNSGGSSGGSNQFGGPGAGKPYAGTGKNQTNAINPATGLPY